MTQCTDLVNFASAGVAPALRAVDCMAGEMTASAFDRLFGADGAMAPVLTICLTLYIVFFALSLLTGRSTLGISALTPRMLTLGLVLTFATSWVAYSQVVWNLTVGAPDWIASVLMGSDGSATQIFADRIDIVFAAIGEIGQAGAGADGGEAAVPGGGGAAGMFQPADVMWLGSLLLLLGTVGVLLTARIALAVLLALGPVFVVMALFPATRGLTAGWVRGVALTALTPLFVVLGGSITLELLVPVLAAMTGSLEGVSGRAAMALFTIAAVHVALMALVFKVAGTMVMGWQVFGLGNKAARAPGHSGAAVYNQVPAMAQGAMQPAGAAMRRNPAVALAASPGAEGAAQGASGGGPGSSTRRRTVVTQVTGGGIEPLRAGSTQARARGIGSRFRSASNDAGGTAGKEMMK